MPIGLTNTTEKGWAPVSIFETLITKENFFLSSKRNCHCPDGGPRWWHPFIVHWEEMQEFDSSSERPNCGWSMIFNNHHVIYHIHGLKTADGAWSITLILHGSKQKTRSITLMVKRKKNSIHNIYHIQVPSASQALSSNSCWTQVPFCGWQCSTNSTMELTIVTIFYESDVRNLREMFKSNMLYSAY